MRRIICLFVIALFCYSSYSITIQNLMSNSTYLVKDIVNEDDWFAFECNALLSVPDTIYVGQPFLIGITFAADGSSMSTVQMKSSKSSDIETIAGPRWKSYLAGPNDSIRTAIYSEVVKAKRVGILQIPDYTVYFNDDVQLKVVVPPIVVKPVPQDLIILEDRIWCEPIKHVYTFSEGIRHPSDTLLSVHDGSVKLPSPNYDEQMELADYIMRNAFVSKETAQRWPDGTLCTFIVKNDGEICDVEVKIPLDSYTDALIAHTLQNMPKWNPAMFNGHNVNYRHSVILDLQYAKYYWKNHEHERMNITIASQDFKGDLPNGVYVEDLREDKDSIKTEPRVYGVAEQMPSFPGGEAALLKYVNSHVKIPRIAEEQEIKGQVVLRFVVNEDGSVGEVIVLKSLLKQCDEEAIRIVKNLPRFIPGRQQGKAVKVWYTLPVRFMPSSSSDDKKES